MSKEQVKTNNYQPRWFDAAGVAITNLFGTKGYNRVIKKHRKLKSTPVGTPYMIRAKLTISDKGSKIAEPGERLDLDAKIQAALPSTDIAAIVARYKAGDESVLHVNPGFVGDAVNLPKDLYDYKAMNALYDKVAGSFDKLPEEIKALFNNSSEEYLNSIISNKAENIIAEYKANQQNQPEQQNSPESVGE